MAEVTKTPSTCGSLSHGSAFRRVVRVLRSNSPAHPYLGVLLAYGSFGAESIKRSHYNDHYRGQATTTGPLTHRKWLYRPDEDPQLFASSWN